MASAPSASWNSRCITHLANCPNRSLPTNSSDESSFKTGSPCQLNKNSPTPKRLFMLTQNHKHVVAWILLSGCLLLVRAAAQPNSTTGSYLSDETRTASFSNSAVPSAAPVASSVLPQFAFGGGWYSALYFTNLTGSPVSFPVNFVSDAGAPLNVPVLGGSTTNVNLAAHGTALIEAPNVGSLDEGRAVCCQVHGTALIEAPNVGSLVQGY